MHEAFPRTPGEHVRFWLEAMQCFETLVLTTPAVVHYASLAFRDV